MLAVHGLDFEPKPGTLPGSPAALSLHRLRPLDRFQEYRPDAAVDAAAFWVLMDGPPWCEAPGGYIARLRQPPPILWGMGPARPPARHVYSVRMSATIVLCEYPTHCVVIDAVADVEAVAGSCRA